MEVMSWGPQLPYDGQAAQAWLWDAVFNHFNDREAATLFTVFSDLDMPPLRGMKIVRFLGRGCAKR